MHPVGEANEILDPDRLVQLVDLIQGAYSLDGTTST
jgi:hypothetical protein